MYELIVNTGGTCTKTTGINLHKSNITNNTTVKSIWHLEIIYIKKITAIFLQELRPKFDKTE